MSTRSLRIAIVTGRFPAVSETFVLNQITGLLDRGHEVHIYAGRPGKSSVVHSDVERYGLRARTTYQPTLPSNSLTRALHVLGLLIRQKPADFRLMLRALNIFKYGKSASSFKLFYAAFPLRGRPAYDIIHAHFGSNGVKAVQLRELGALTGKIVVSFHGADVNVRPQRAGFGNYDELFAKGDLFTANTNFTVGRLRALGCPAEKIARLPVGVDVARFQPVARRRNPGGPIRLLTVARLVEAKGVEYALRALPQVVARWPDVEYRIVGDGPLRAELEALAAQLGVARQVRFLGEQTHEQVNAALAEADLFVLPSVVGRDGSEETQGLVLIEAQAMGLPVVASRIGGIPESLAEGVSGFLVPQRDAEALGRQLIQLIERRDSWEEMGRAGRAFVEQNFDLRGLNDRLVELYEQAMRGRA